MTSFFELSTPDYDTDQQDARANPVEQIIEYQMPGIHCSACGSTWSDYKRKYIQVHDADLIASLTSLDGWPIEDKAWNILRDRLAASIPLPSNFRH